MHPVAPQEILSSIFGYHSFRPAQKDIIEAVIEGKDCLVIMPTGGGKSLCYQIPALLREGTGIVVSPLIALMKDQVDALRQLGVKAAFLNSSLSASEASEIEGLYLRNEIDLLYLAPERLNTEECIEFLLDGKPALFAIDEAHCVSQWGHDFRPDYLGLAVLKEKFANVPRIALTATADAPTRSDIISSLKLSSPKNFITGFNRPNICYRVVLKANPKNQLLEFLEREHPDDAGIVYCLSRRKVEETAEWLQAKGRLALPYHAGLDQDERTRNQEKFLRDEGIIIVATIAFGMGIDKPDVKFVAHLDLPKSIEAYYQETGRAGRDGLPANARMFYGLQDIVLRRQMMDKSEADEKFKQVEQRKLNALLGYCETTECRRKVLLHYFGEEFEAPCQNCDICLDGAETWDGTQAAQKALSCVYRTGQRFGANYLIETLRGEATERHRRFGHDSIPTFGVGADLNPGSWHSVFRQLIASGYLSVDIAGYGGLQLTNQSKDILKGEKQVLFRKDTLNQSGRSKSRKKTRSSIHFEGEQERNLWEALRKRRLELAREQGVPPYVIFHDSTLKEIVERRPKTMRAFSFVSGVGETKLERYGEKFVEIVKEHSI